MISGMEVTEYLVLFCGTNIPINPTACPMQIVKIMNWMICTSTTDLKIDWIWHLLLKIEAGVIGPTLVYSTNSSRNMGCGKNLT